LPIFVIALSMTAGCAVGTEEITTDPNDAGVLSDLGLGPQEGVIWSRAVAGFEVIGVRTAADPVELELLSAAIAEIPDEVLSLVEVRNIVRIDELPDADLHPATLALARGPDIFLFDATFAALGPDPTAYGLAGVIAHEIAHVGQYAALEPAEIEALLAGSAPVDPITASAFVRNYADATGWRDAGSDPATPVWVPPGSAAASAYARTAPEEDMAESFAAIALGRSDGLAPERIDFIEAWTGSPARAFTNGRPFVPAGAEPIESASPLYDEEAVDRYNAGHVEPEYFLLPADAPPIDDLVATIGAELNRRGLAGTLQSVAAAPAPRYHGYFLRGDGVGWWVEVWEFRDGGYRNAPDGPVLAYVMLR
jgi:hypothetical protein